jgi:hypothetical protein
VQFECTKAEDCFADSSTYKYKIPLTGEGLLPLLAGYAVRKNKGLRRPVFVAEKGDVKIKGVLSDSFIMVSFGGDAYLVKADFDRWMEDVDG